MNSRAVLTLGAAFVMAGGAVLLTKNWLSNQVQPPVVVERQGIETVPVVVAAAPLAFGAPVERGQLKVIQWPAESVPTGIFASIDDVVDGEEPRVVLRAVAANEPLLPAKITGFGGRASLSAVIGGDKRAATIRVNDVNGVAGFVLPGDRVDIMLTRTDRNGELVTGVLLQTVRVLAVDQDYDAENEQPVVAKAVTLEVSPNQAQKLALASELGSLSLTLRGEASTNQVVTRPVSTADLEGRKVTGGKAGPSVQIVRGLEAQHYAVRPGQSVGAMPSVPVVPAPVADHEAAVEGGVAPVAAAVGG